MLSGILDPKRRVGANGLQLAELTSHPVHFVTIHSSPVMSPIQSYIYIYGGRLPRASLRCTLGYHLVVLSGLAVRCRKLRNEAMRSVRGFKVPGSRFKII